VYWRGAVVIYLLPVGQVDGAVLKSLQQSIAQLFLEEVSLAGAIPLQADSWNRRREQYDADVILSGIPSPPHGSKILAVTGVDLFAQGLNFVFGAARESSQKAVLSFWRLRPEVYYQPHDEALFRKRILTEAVHELGHAFGLGHCPNTACVMYFSNTLKETDQKGWKPCKSCRDSLNKILGPR
jgi:archaemetzincin